MKVRVWWNLILVAIGLASAPLLAQGLAAEVSPSADTLRWAIQVGGPLFALDVILLWFYRRDLVRLLAESEARGKTLADVVVANTAAFRDYANQYERLARELEKE